MDNSDRQSRTQSELASLLKELNGEIEHLLVTEGIFAVDSYGWVDHDEADPKYLGHAMWQTEPPFRPDFSVLTGGGIVSYAPTRRDEVLTRNGEDFVATMNAARRSMGNALARWKATESGIIGISDEFWEDYSICTMLLAIASDRIRDFLVMAVENTEYDSKTSEAAQRTMLKRAIEKVPGLEQLAMQSHKFKEVRNGIVHNIATLAAQRSIDSLREQRRHAISGQPVEIWEPTFQELEVAFEEAKTEARLNVEIQQMKRWHQCLIEASNLIFEAEHLSRSRG